MSYNNYLAGELDSLSDDRSSIDWDNGDRLRWLGSALVGRGAEFSREGVRARAKKEQEKKINQKLTGDRRQITDSLAGTGIDTSRLTLGGNRTIEDLDAEMSSLRTKGVLAQQYAAMENADLSDIKDGTSIQQLASGLKKSNKKADEAATEAKRTTRLKETYAREDGLTARENIRADTIRAEDNLRRSQERTQDLELRRDQMNMNYATMARRDRMDAKDRKDKNIMMLMQGLAGIATGFTV
ncbi:hypothetical protein N8654_02125 [Synechococcus sp. AH-601-B19]|nr:hypothetical protein [Synechococcus sp. AH-601-B19]